MPHEPKGNEVGLMSPDENESSQMSVYRLLVILKSVYQNDRVSLIKQMIPKLTTFSFDELKKILEMLYENDRIDGLEILLPLVNKPLSDKEFDILLTLFYTQDVPNAVKLLTDNK